MRLLVVAHSAVLASYRHRWELLARRGHKVTLLTPPAWTEGNRWVLREPSPQGELHVIESRPVGTWLPTPRLRNVAHFHPSLPGLLEKLKPEVLEVFEEPYSLAAWHAFRAARDRAPECLRLVFSAQNLVKTYPWPFRAFERSVLQLADAALPVDPLVIPVLRAKGLKAPAPIVPLGIDPAAFLPSAPESSLIPVAARGDAVIGYFGKLQEEKGILDMVTALRQMKTRAHLVIAGAGPLKERLQASWPGRVHLVGSLPQTRLPRFLGATDLVVVPSKTTSWWKEQFGRAALEAMACGRPTLVSDSGSLPHVVGNGALVLPEGQPKVWATAADRLLASGARRRKLGTAGREHVLSRYSWSAVADAHEAAWTLAAAHRA